MSKNKLFSLIAILLYSNNLKHQLKGYRYERCPCNKLLSHHDLHRPYQLLMQNTQHLKYTKNNGNKNQTQFQSKLRKHQIYYLCRFKLGVLLYDWSQNHGKLFAHRLNHNVKHATFCTLEFFYAGLEFFESAIRFCICKTCRYVIVLKITKV